MAIQEEALRFAGVGLYRYRFDGTVIDINQAALEILGLADRFAGPADVIGRRIEDLIVYVGAPRRIRDLIRRHGEARNVLYPFRTLDGTLRWVLHDSFAVADPASGEQVIQAIIKDVTEAHRRELDLRQSQERLTRIVETIDDGIIIIDTEGHFTFANPATEDIFGLPRSVITSRTIRDPAWKLTTIEGRPIAPQKLPFMRVMHSGETVRDVRFAVERPDGSRAILSVNGAPLRNEGDAIVGVLLTIGDISERVRLERLRDEFLSTAAHELKTPVATIKGYAQLLQQWAPGGHETREGQAFDIINRQSDRLNRLVQQLLEFSRLQYQRFRLYTRRFDLGDLAGQVVARMQATSPDCRLRLERQGAVLVNADPDRIDEVLVNLLDNAIKASHPGGVVDIRVYAVGNEARVSVRDYGVGIPPEKQPHIFERFFQAHAGTPYERGGMGMGLYLSREIIAQHRGCMWFKSTIGHGSTFYFSLPLARERGDG